MKHKRLEIKKLDKRNRGYGEFKYFIRTFPLHEPDYHSLREWMWQTWGPSKELIEWLDDSVKKFWAHEPLDPKCQNENWCWQNDQYYRRLYLRGDEQLVLFKLRWE